MSPQIMIEVSNYLTFMVTLELLFLSLVSRTLKMLSRNKRLT